MEEKIPQSSTVSLEEQRQQLRQGITARRDGLSPALRRRKSEAIGRSLLALSSWQAAQYICIYVHFRSEVETGILLDQALNQGKIVTVPYTLAAQHRIVPVRITDPERDLVPGFQGIPEPVPALVEQAAIDPGVIELVVVPGLVFDCQGGRLGYGGGFYDRFLAREAPQARRLGLAFGLQLVSRLPLAVHDIPMDLVISEEGVWTGKRERS
ncbi:5-formyltetrahydrofolate cyclo-ligase [Desulfogranum mediterraneum]|uniref:5-formyltetrahydrofolate cyclo-ligase n=1 Tax=Desulfogranum mediterraneum TaxID=160661 RepID=UPI000426653B|nr:5-formyltetrahydrofolate cyclo-ligase [Desulfogranum mediterraneum]